MNIIKKSIISFTFLFSYILCVGEAGAVFLLINPGSSAAGVGEAQTGKADDAYATYYNPAGLAFLEQSEIALQHVNWLPNLAADIYYEFITYAMPVKDIGTFGGHIIYLNLGEQLATDEIGTELGKFKSYMMALNASFGMKVREYSSIGFNFKVFHQKLADSYYSSDQYDGTAVGSEEGDPFSTDFAFDIGFLKKFGKEKQHQFGLAIQNIGPEISFVDAEQADPAPTNMRIGLYTRLYKDDKNSIHLLFDANKLLVASYPEMDWNGNGRIDRGTKEESHSDKWTKALYTAWLDDWHYGGDLNLCEEHCLQELYSDQIGYDNDEFDDIIGGYEVRDFIWEAPIDSDGNLGVLSQEIYVPNYANFCIDDIANCYSDEGLIVDPDYDISSVKWIDLPHDELGDSDTQWYDAEILESNPEYWNGGLVPCLADDIGSNDPERAGCSYEDPSKEDNGYPDPGDVRIIDFIHLETLERWDIGEDDIWGVNPETGIDDDALLNTTTIESDFDCTTLSSAGDIFFGELGKTDVNGKWAPQGFCYSGKSTCTEIGGKYNCRYDIPYKEEYAFTEEGYGVFNPFGNKEKGTGKDRKFSDEFKEMIYNFGFEWWYTDNFAMRLGYIYDEEGDIKNPTFGAGVHFNRYGFDFGYTAGDKGHPRANTMFFSLSLGI